MINVLKSLTLGIVLLVVSIGCSLKADIRSQAFYETTLIYLGLDISSINYNDLEKSEYNDLIYKNIMTKFVMINSYPKDTGQYSIVNLSSDSKNTLCLASIFVDNYQPLESNGFNNKIMLDNKLYLASLKSDIIEDIDYDELPHSSKRCNNAVVQMFEKDKSSREEL